MNKLTSRQILFRDMILGILVYAVVLGFFNDYTDVIQTTSYSVTFLVAITMQVLTYLTLLVKKKAVSTLINDFFVTHKAIIGFAIWLIMFFSKFVFLAVIDVLFGTAVEISGFIGLLLVIVTVTVVSQSLLHVQKNLD